jgi:MFS family permease
VNRRAARWLIASATAVALADGSIVTLALPQLLDQLNTTVEGVAAVLGVYCAVLAIALPLADRLRRLWGMQTVGVAGLVVFGSASLGCAAADSLPVLLVMRGVQGAGAAAGLLLSFELLHGASGEGRQLWTAAAIFGTAAGPAIGGALTQAFSWRAIFIAGAPVGFAAAIAAVRLRGAESGPSTEPGWARRAAAHSVAATELRRAPGAAGESVAATELRGAPGGARESAAPAEPQPAPGRLRIAAIALALTAATLSAVLFLLVLLLVLGWGLSPLAAAAALTVLPATAVGASRIRGEPTARAALGCLLLGAGVLTLAFLPRPSVWWLLAPEILAGCGMGMALPTLAGELMPERTTTQSGHLLALRHAGIALTLLALAPLIANQLSAAEHHGRLLGVAALLDSPLSTGQKLALAPSLATSLDSENPRQSLANTVAAKLPGLSSSDRVALVALERVGDAILVQVAQDGLHYAFLITGALGVLAALLLRPPRRPELGSLAAASCLVLPVGYAIAEPQLKPTLPKLTSACQPGAIPQVPGLSGLLQGFALSQLDRLACARGISREELLLELLGSH